MKLRIINRKTERWWIQCISIGNFVLIQLTDFDLSAKHEFWINFFRQYRGLP